MKVPAPTSPRSTGLRGVRPNSFSLIEVVVALAVIAFVMVSLLGLMSYASTLVRQSDSYARLSRVTSQVRAQFDSQPFTMSSNLVTTNAIYYYTYDGLPTNQAGGYYECDTASANPTDSTLTNLMQILVTVRWPMPARTETNYIVTSTLNYD